MQLCLVALLDAELADVLGAAVVIGVITLVNLFFFGLVNAAYIADHVAGQFAKRIVAKQSGLDFHAGETVALRRKACYLGVGQTRANRQGFKAARLFQQLLEAAPVARRDVQHLGQIVQHLVQRPTFAGRDFERIGRVIAGQHDAIAIQDQPPVGNDGHDGGAVVFGLCAQLFVAPDLQIQQAGNQQQKADQHHQTEHKDAGTKPRQINLDIP